MKENPSRRDLPDSAREVCKPTIENNSKRNDGETWATRRTNQVEEAVATSDQLGNAGARLC